MSHFYNAQGKLVMEGEITEPMHTLSVKHLPAGIHAIVFNQFKTLKFVKL